MKLSIVTPPSEEPVTLSEAKAHNSIDISASDTLISAFITTARTIAENYTRRAFVTTVYKLTLDQFPMYGWDHNTIWLPRADLVSVGSITYVDTAGSTQTLASDQYLVSIGAPPRITPAYNLCYPNTRCQMDAVNITFTCGYGAATAVPTGIKTAICQMVAHLYENRAAVIEGNYQIVPYTYEALLDPFVWGKR